MSKKMPCVPLKKWSNYFKYPSQVSMMKLIMKAHQNGADYFLLKINGRYFIHIGKFHKWLANQKSSRVEDSPIENIQHYDCVSLRRWRRYSNYPSQSVMRKLSAKMHENGTDDFFFLDNEKIYILIQRFDRWLARKLLDIIH